MGNIAKPAELHKLQGTDRADRATTQPVVIKGTVADPPTRIKFEEGIDENQIFDLLSDWVVKVTGAAKIDGLMLSQLVDQYKIYSLAKIDVEAKGMMLQSNKEGGGEYVNPQLFNMNTALDKIHKLMREFGMTPATRSQVHAQNQMDVDPFDAFHKGPKG